MTDHTSPPESTTPGFEPPVPSTPAADERADAVPVSPTQPDPEAVVPQEEPSAPELVSEEAPVEAIQDDDVPSVAEDAPAPAEPEPAEVAAAESDAELRDEDVDANPASESSAAEVSDDDVEQEADEAVADATTTEPAVVQEAPPDNKKWYVVKVQSGREDTIKAAIERQVKIRGLEESFGRIVIPVEKVVTLRGGKRVTKYTKKFAGYLMCNVEFNENILYLFRETSGVGDFVGGSLTRPPQPMTDREVQSMLANLPEVDDKGKPKPVKVDIKFAKGDRVRIREGTFADMEGEVKEILEPKEVKDNVKIRVEVTIWGRPAAVDLEHWQIDPV